MLDLMQIKDALEDIYNIEFKVMDMTNIAKTMLCQNLAMLTLENSTSQDHVKRKPLSKWGGGESRKRGKKNE